MTEYWTSAALWVVQSSVAASALILTALLVARFTRQPARRQRLCELGLTAALLAVAVSLAPAWLVVGLPLKAPQAAAPAEPTPLDVPHDLWIALTPDTWPPDGEDVLATLPAVQPPAPAVNLPVDDSAGIGVGALAAIGLLLVYGLGVLFFVARWLGGWWHLRRLLRDAEPASPQVVALLGIRPCHRAGPRVLVSRRLRVPISCGVWRPTVVLPVEFCQASAWAKLPWVFAHELTHVERRDALSAVLFAVGQAVFFHLPWFWRLRHQVRLCQEYVADASAVANRPADEYAEFLLSLTETQALPLGTTGVGGPVSDLFRRVTMLLQNPLPVEKRCPRLWTYGLASVLVALAVLVGGVGLQAAAGDTIIIIIAGQKAKEPAKDEKTKPEQAKKEAVRLWVDQADDKIIVLDPRTGQQVHKDQIFLFLDDKGNVVQKTATEPRMHTSIPGGVIGGKNPSITLFLDDKGNVIPKDVPIDVIQILVDKDGKAVPLNILVDKSQSIATDKAKNQANRLLREEIEKLQKVLADLQKVGRDDVKEVRELANRLRERLRALELDRLKLQGFELELKLANPPLEQPKKDVVKPKQPGQVQLWPKPNVAVPLEGQWHQYLAVTPGQVDLQKLQKLLEKLQADPSKVDPKAISKALEELRKSQPNWNLNTVKPWIAEQYQQAFTPQVGPDGKTLFYQHRQGRFGIRSLSTPSADLRAHLDLPKDQGIVIEEVIPDTPAARAGLKAKDIVLKVGDTPVPSDTGKALKVFADVPDGASVDLTIVQRGKRLLIQGVKPAPRPAAQAYDDALNAYKIALGARTDKVPEKGALVSILSDGEKFTAKYREKQVSITIEGKIPQMPLALRNPTDVQIKIEVGGKVALEAKLPPTNDLSSIPAEWRQRVSRLLDLIRMERD